MFCVQTAYQSRCLHRNIEVQTTLPHGDLTKQMKQYALQLVSVSTCHA